MINQSRSETAVFALGGLGEVGKNLYCIEHEETLILIDAGVMFPENELLGVDYVIPDFSYLIFNQYKIKALLITHGHEDHIGGIPFLLQKVNIPTIYATKLASALIKNKLEENHIRQKINIVEVDGSTSVNIDKLKIDFFDTTHSIPDSVGICIDTPNGKIVTSGDFKIDLTPVGNQHIDLQKIAKIGESGVTLFMSDSTNAEAPGLSLSESSVVKSINDVFKNTEGRLLVATFASNIHRIQQLVETAVKFKRKICIIGRSMEKTIQIGRKYGYISCPDSSIIQEEEVKFYPSNELVIICTGSQGEPLAALSRIANDTHKYIKIIPGDTVVFSSSAIPGNGADINKVVNKLYRQGASVITNSILNNIHASGHANQEELKYILSIIKPKYFMPIHGEYRMLKIHTELAQQVGIEKQNTFVLENGDRLLLDNGTVRQGSRIDVEDIYVDGKDTTGLSANVIRDRKIMSNNGVIICTVNIDSHTNTLTTKPYIVSRGFTLLNDSYNILEEASNVVNNDLNELFKGKVTFQSVKNTIKTSLSAFLYEKTHRSPLIIPVILNKRESLEEVINYMTKEKKR